MKESIERRLSAVELERIYSEHLAGWKKLNDQQALARCCFHKDDVASLSINLNPTRLAPYYCHACGSKGNIYTFINKKIGAERPLVWLAERLGVCSSSGELEHTHKAGEFSPGMSSEACIIPSPHGADTPAPSLEPINNKVVLRAHEALYQNTAKLQQLISFGMRGEIIKKRLLGWDGNRFTIPIYNKSGAIVNVRRYQPGNKRMTVIGYAAGYNEARLYPIENLNNTDIYMFEGEKDCLVAESIGLNAITPTGGAQTWKAEWNELFRNKNVYIVGDIDEAGVQGSLKRANALYNIAASVKIINLPLDPKIHPTGDFTDYIMEGNDRNAFNKLVEMTDPFSIEGGETSGTPEIRASLADAGKPNLINKKCQLTNIMVTGKDRSPYVVPAKISVECKRGQAKCGFCPANVNTEVRISKSEPLIAGMIGMNDRLKNKFVQRMFHLNCNSFIYTELEYYSVEKATLSQNLVFNIEDSYEHVNRVGYYVSSIGDPKLQGSTVYDMKCVNTNDPANQSLVHIIYHIEQSNLDIDTFKVDKDIEGRLTRFQCQPTVAAIENKLKEIYNEYEKLARIYQRQDLFLLFDLSFHSAISFIFQGKPIGKGWVEGCVIGDSGSAKTSAARFLIGHYHAGEYIDGETLTEAGLKGAMHQTTSGKQWQLQWGRLPINDRRLVVLDEASGIEPDIIANLSSIRSSGECIISKAIKDQTMSRTRIIWLGNPRKGNVSIRNYTFGVEVIKDFFGKPEDVRRCDIATTCASGDVPQELINSKHEAIIPTYTSELCTELLRFAWSRKSEDIHITEKAEEKILEKSIMLGKKYSSAIPLVEPADIRNKLARLAVALAVRLFNYKDKIVYVEPAHVEFIVKWLDYLFSKPSFRYDAYSDKENRKVYLQNEADVEWALKLVPNPLDCWTQADVLLVIQGLLDSALHNKNELALILNEDERDIGFRNRLSKLKKANAIGLLQNNTIKINPCLIEFLRQTKKKLEQEGYTESPLEGRSEEICPF